MAEQRQPVTVGFTVKHQKTGKPFIHRVAVERIEHEDDDKVVCRRRHIIASIDGEKVLRRFARAEALAVAHLWDMSAIAREYLETGDEAKRAAAWAAARAAANDRLEAMVLAEMGLER